MCQWAPAVAGNKAHLFLQACVTVSERLKHDGYERVLHLIWAHGLLQVWHCLKDLCDLCARSSGQNALELRKNLHCPKLP